MKILFDKTFKKDIIQVKDKKLADLLKKVIFEFEESDNIFEISEIKKIKGYKNYFRKRLGIYRIGFKFENNQIVFIRFKHRKDIYKVFP